MIGDVLVLLKNRLNGHFRSIIATTPDDNREDKFVFVEGDQKSDQIPFKLDAVSLLLFNIEQDKSFRQGDPYARASAAGATMRSQPDIAFNLHVLFVARFKAYEQGLHYLSLIIRYFQSHNCLDHQNTPELSEDIDHLVVELVSMSVAQQNELWGSLRTSYLPSIAYKLRVLVFRSEDVLPRIETIEPAVDMGPL